MNSQELVDLFRLDMSDVATPPLWSDDEIFGYADEAQKSFVRAIGGIADSSTPNLAVIPVAVNDVSFLYDARILKIRKAFRQSDGAPVLVMNYENVELQGLKFDGSKGPVQMFVTGMDDGLAYYKPIPSVADTLQMMVDRLPLNTLSLADAPQDLEIPEHHHRHLLKGMKALAYGKQDAETFNKSKSEDFERQFNVYGEKAMRERERRIHKNRSVAYGGLSVGSYPYLKTTSTNY